MRDEGRQPSSVEVAHEGLQRDRRWWILKSESVKRNEKISNETTHPDLSKRSPKSQPNRIESRPPPNRRKKG